MPAATAEHDQETDSVANAAKELLGADPASSMPEVDLQAVATGMDDDDHQETAVNQQIPPPAAPAPAAPAQAAATASKPALVDSKGRLFDPLLHEHDDQGKPLLRADGQTLKCRRVPLTAAKTTSKVQLDTPAPAAGDPAAAASGTPQPMDPEKAKKMREAGAATCAGMQIYLMRTGLGEHVAEADTDREALVDCWRDMFEYYGLQQMHPIVGLAVVTGMITFKALNEPEAQSRWQRGTLWLRLKLGGWWYWMTGKKAKPAQAPVTPENDDATDRP